MDAMRRSLTETLRLYPPLVLLMRKVITARTVGPFTVPKGDVVGVCVPVQNRDERYWTDGAKFNPGRFNPGEAEAEHWSARTVEHGPSTGKMLSFGGGPHMCTGRRFGFLQIQTIWAILLRDFDLELVGDVPPPNYNDMVVGPTGPITVRYKRKKR